MQMILPLVTTSHTKYQNCKNTNAYRQRHKEKGLCRCCPKPVYQNRWCLYHYLRWVEADKRRKQRRIENNKCRSCGRPLIEEEMGRIACFNCGIDLHPILLKEQYNLER